MNTQHIYSPEQQEDIQALMEGAALHALCEEDMLRFEAYLEQDPDLAARFVQYLECSGILTDAVAPATILLPARKQRRLKASPDTFPMVWRSHLPELKWRTLLLLLLGTLTVITGVTNFSLRRRLYTAEMKLEHFSDPDIHLHLLQGNQPKQTASGTVLIDVVANRANLTLQNVRPLKPGEVFAMWAKTDNQTVLCAQFQAYTSDRVVEALAIPPNVYASDEEFTLMITIQSSQGARYPSNEVLMTTQFEI